MTLNKPSKIKKFRDFNEAAESILALISKQVGINTLFIAKNDGNTNEIVKARNKQEELVTAGTASPLEDTFCSLSLDYGDSPLVIEDISADEKAKSLKIAAQFDKGSFIGIPIYYGNGDTYGTICGLDDRSYDFTEEHISLFETMSSLLTYVLELEKANEQIESLSSPLVPVTKGVSILPVIGEITAKRAQVIIDNVLYKCGEEDVEYLVIDISGVSQINTAVGVYLLKLVNLMKLIGVTPVITGFQPFMAVKVPHFAAELKGVMIEANLETVLKRLGFVLIKDCKEKTVHS